MFVVLSRADSDAAYRVGRARQDTNNAHGVQNLNYSGKNDILINIAGAVGELAVIRYIDTAQNVLIDNLNLPSSNLTNNDTATSGSFFDTSPCSASTDRFDCVTMDGRSIDVKTTDIAYDHAVLQTGVWKFSPSPDVYILVRHVHISETCCVLYIDGGVSGKRMLEGPNLRFLPSGAMFRAVQGLTLLKELVDPCHNDIYVDDDDIIMSDNDHTDVAAVESAILSLSPTPRQHSEHHSEQQSELKYLSLHFKSPRQMPRKVVENMFKYKPEDIVKYNATYFISSGGNLARDANNVPVASMLGHVMLTVETSDSFDWVSILAFLQSIEINRIPNECLSTSVVLHQDGLSHDQQQYVDGSILDDSKVNTVAIDAICVHVNNVLILQIPRSCPISLIFNVIKQEPRCCTRLNDLMIMSESDRSPPVSIPFRV